MDVLPAFESVHHVYVLYSWRPEENILSPVIEIIDGCGLPYRCRELNLGLLEEQPVSILNH